MPAKLPQNVIEMRGKSHQTKAEKEARRAAEPQVETVKRLRAPAFLPERLRADFNEVSKELIKANILTKLDTDTVAAYIMSRDAWITAHAHAQDAMTTKDIQKIREWTRVAKTYFEQCHTCATDLGLTITSRCRLVVPKPPEDAAANDPVARMLQARAERRRRVDG